MIAKQQTPFDNLKINDGDLTVYDKDLSLPIYIMHWLYYIPQIHGIHWLWQNQK